MQASLKREKELVLGKNWDWDARLTAILVALEGAVHSLISVDFLPWS